MNLSNLLKGKSYIALIIGLEVFAFCILTLLLLHKEFNLTSPFNVDPTFEKKGNENARKPIKIVHEVHAQSSASFDVAKFQSYGFPAPQDPNPAEMSESALQGWNQYLRDAVAKASSATGVDPGIIGMWPYVETQGSWVPFDNCNQELNGGFGGDSNPNTQCPLWGDYWQVGPGNHLAYTHSFIPEAFDVMYGSQDNETVQQVGQSVIDSHTERFGSPLTIVTSFPNRSLSSIIDDAVGGDLTSRTLMATLMKDDAIGVYLIARHFKDNIGINSGLASKMEGWSSSYYGRQKIVNHIKAIYDAGVSGGGGTSGGLGSGSQTFTLVLRPNEPDSWVINRVTANAVGGGSGSSESGLNVPPGSFDGQCTPTGEYPSDIAGELQRTYNTTIVNYNEEYSKYIYDVFTCLSDTNFPELTSFGTIVSNVNGGRYFHHGCTDKCRITMEANLPEANFKHILIHEFGHMIDSSNTREALLYTEFNEAWSEEGGLSPYSGGGNGCSAGGPVEDFAENVAYFYQPSSGQATGACDNRGSYPNPLYDTDEFPDHLDVATRSLL